MMNTKLTTCFPTSYRWSAYVTQSVAQKAIFKNKIQLQSNKVCYKVSSCENFQRKSCSITIPYLTVHRYRREINVTLQTKIWPQIDPPLKVAELSRSLCHC